MSYLKFAVAMVFLTLANHSLSGQPLKAPKIGCQGDEMKFDGRFVHIRGKKPASGGKWFYNVEQKRANLYVYSIWQVSEFMDRKEKDHGFYNAKSWTIEVLDAESNPEKEVIIDHANEFFFWGKVISRGEQTEVLIQTIQGLPSSSYGPVVLKPLL